MSESTESIGGVKCVLCHHVRGIGDVNGLCAAQVQICSDDYHGTRQCGCRCVFPATEAAAFTDEYVRTLQSNYASLEDFVREIREILNLHGPTPDILGELRGLVAATGTGEGSGREGWVTFGRVKVDIENETETFERISPPRPRTASTASVAEGEEKSAQPKT